MARQGFFQRLVGGAVNAALPGKPYSRYSGYNPTLTRNSIISGVAGHAIPGGGLLAQAFLNQSPAAQAAMAGQSGRSWLGEQVDATNSDWRDGNSDFDSSGIRADFAPIAGVSSQGGWSPGGGLGQFNPAAQPVQPTTSQASLAPTGFADGIFNGGSGNFGGGEGGSGGRSSMPSMMGGRAAGKTAFDITRSWMANR